MLVSMTGFSSFLTTATLAQGQKVYISMKLKTLNSRYFEAHSKIPLALSNLETELVALIKKKLIRGQAYFSISINNPGVLQGPIEPSLATVKGYMQALDRIKQECALSGQVTIGDIMQLPDIFSISDTSLEEEFRATMVKATEQLIEQVVAMRQQEGAMLAKDILLRAAIMGTEIEVVAQESTVLLENQKAKMQSALQEVAGNPEALAELQKRVVYTALDKMDIHEEIVRFKGHLEHFKQHIASPKIEKGKLLDFTLQELAREINTIAAKCSDMSIGTRAITIKVELEKAREQIQNIV